MTTVSLQSGMALAAMMSALGAFGTLSAGLASAASGVATLDGKAPLVIGHRGLPGLYPESTRPAYEAAADAGADALELDVHLSRDCVLVARHNPWLSDNTNIAAVAQTNPAVAARKRSTPGVQVKVGYDSAVVGGPAFYLSDRLDAADPKSVLKALVVDGEDHTGDWAISDFTVAELQKWLGGTTYDARDERPSGMNGKYPILTMQQVFDIARAKSAALGRTIAVYPESKNPAWNNAQGVANGCGSGAHPFEDAIVKLINDNGMNNKRAAVFVQSFDPASLKYMRTIGLATKVVQLVDGNAVNYRSGAVIYQTADASNFVSARPYSWTLAGDGRFFDAMLTPAGLAEIKTYADGIGPWKPQLMAWTIAPFNGGSGYGLLADVNTATPTTLIVDAHQAGLFVHSFTFRNERKYLAGMYNGDPKAELQDFFGAGIDGVFSDFTPTAVQALDNYKNRPTQK